jgi:hypothetical protein
MTVNQTVMHGTIRGRQIELEGEVGLPDGQAVTVVIRPQKALPENYAEIVRSVAGSWADEGPELDEYLRTCRQELPGERPDLEP